MRTHELILKMSKLTQTDAHTVDAILKELVNLMLSSEEDIELWNDFCVEAVAIKELKTQEGKLNGKKKKFV